MARKKTETTPDAAQAADVAPTTAPTTKAKPKRRRKAATPTGAKTAPKAPAKPKKARPPKEDLVVFAFRLTQAERDAIHKTSGPRNATQFVRRAAVAFAGEDEAAFKAVLKEARELRK